MELVKVLLDKVFDKDKDNNNVILFVLLLSILLVAFLASLGDGDSKVGLISFLIVVGALTLVIFSVLMGIANYINTFFNKADMVDKLTEINKELSQHNLQDKWIDKYSDKKREKIINYYKKEYQNIISWTNKKSKSLINSYNFTLLAAIILFFSPELFSDNMKGVVILSILAVFLISIGCFNKKMKELLTLQKDIAKKINDFEKSFNLAIQHVSAVDQDIHHQPIDKASRVASIKAGDPVKLIDVHDSKWFKVNHNGTKGFVRRSDITTRANFEDANSAVDLSIFYQMAKNQKLRVVTDSAIRRQAGQQHQVLTKVTRDTRVDYKGTVRDNEDWFKVEFNGEKGYIFRGNVTKIQ